MTTSAYIIDIVHTPRGVANTLGALYEVKPIDLLALVLNELVQRNGFSPDAIEDLFVGCQTPVHEQGGNIARAVALYIAWAHSVPGLQLNRWEASSLEALSLAAVKVSARWSNLIAVAGVASNSRIPVNSDGNLLLYDPAVNTKIGYLPQAISADLLASLHNISRSELDEYALQSVQRAQHFTHNPCKVPVYDRCKLPILEQDELLAQLSAAPHTFSPYFTEQSAALFDKIAIAKYPQVHQIQHIHTQGNSAQYADGAAAALIANDNYLAEHPIKPLAKIISAASCAEDVLPGLTGGIAAAEKALRVANLAPTDIDLWEVHEAFAVVPIVFAKYFGISHQHLNVHGGAIALGNPTGATGLTLLASLVVALQQQNLTKGLVAVGTPSGMGCAIIIEILPNQ
jgi:acetyl-CoA C-acetyltransferase